MVKTKEQIIEDMKNCEQTKGQSVYEHGESVLAWIEDIMDYLWYNQDNDPPEKWKNLDHIYKLPECVFDYQFFPIHNMGIVETYLLYHDIGKPYCRTVDEDGRVHFPNHAEVSKQVFKEAFSDDPNCDIIANLIGWDMVIHTASAKVIEHHLKEIWSKKDAFTLMLAALAELHSNAQMFGGIESTSFKIKYKKVSKRCKQIIKFYKEDEDVQHFYLRKIN